MPITYLDDSPKITYLDDEQSPDLLQNVANKITDVQNKIGDFVKPALQSIQPYVQSQLGSPQQLLQSIPSLANQAADKLGQVATEQMGQQGVNPYVSAAIGTGISMAPQIAMSAAPESEAEPSTIGAKTSRNFGLSSLGFTKRFTKNQSMFENATNAVKILTDNGVIKPFSTVENMAMNNSQLAQESGQRIGNFLNSMSESGKFFDTKEAMEEINNLRPKTQSGQVLNEGPYYQAINQKIDDALATINAHKTDQLGWTDANNLKGTLQDVANFNSNKQATLLDKIIAGKFRENLDKQLTDFAEENGNKQGIEQFKNDKKIYGATQIAQDPIYNRLSSELGNKKIGLMDFIVGAPMLAAGEPLTALATLAVKHVAENFGPQMMTVGANNLSKAAKYLTSIPGVSGLPGSMAGLSNSLGLLSREQGNNENNQ